MSPTHGSPDPTTAPQGHDAVLIIDSDPNVLHDLDRLLRGLGNLRFAKTAEEAIAALQDKVHYSVVIAEIRMPGLDGDMVLSWMRELHPESLGILTAKSLDARAIANAVNEGGVFRVLLKPLGSIAVREAVQQAQQQSARQSAERELLEGTLKGSLAAIAGMLSLVQPAAFGRASRVRRISSLVAERVGLPNKWEIEIAALLSQFGCVMLPMELVERLYHNQPIDDAEEQRIRMAIESTLHQLEPIPRMARVCEIIRAVDVVPLRSESEALHARPSDGDAERVLTLALDFDVLFAEFGSAKEALQVMESRLHGGRYHRPYFETLRSIVGVANLSPMIEIPLSDVRLDQIFAADVKSPSDLLLVARGQVVTRGLLDKIHDTWSGFASHTMVRMILPKPPDAGHRQRVPKPDDSLAPVGAGT